jgi:hypothetical protein
VWEHRELNGSEKVLKLLKSPLLILHQRSTVLQFTPLYSIFFHF